MHGRIKILSDLVPTGDIDKDKNLIPIILQETLTMHDKNAERMRNLVDYYYNKTKIINKTKIQQQSINNKIAIGYAQAIVTQINGYAFANNFSISSRNAEKVDEIKKLNDALDDDSYFKKFGKIALDSGITGLGYRYIKSATASDIENGIYFKSSNVLSPLDTYVVYSNDEMQEKIMAVNRRKVKTYNSETGSKNGEITNYIVWTKYHKWEFIKDGSTYINTEYNVIEPGKKDATTYYAYPLAFKRIPVIEYLRKPDRTGDFELHMDLIDAINALASSRVDAVEQTVDYLVLLRDIDTESDGALDRVKEAIEDGIMSFKSIEGATVQPDVDILSVKLDQGQVQKLQDYLTEKLEEMSHIPNRQQGGTGGDTGQAVEGRNGFRSLENISSIITNSMLESETKSLDVILQMSKNIPECDFKNLTTKDIEVKDNRNKYENLNSTVSAYATLIGAGMNDITALEVTRITNDPNTVAEMNKKEALENAREEKELGLKKESIVENINENKTETIMPL